MLQISSTDKLKKREIYLEIVVQVQQLSNNNYTICYTKIVFYITRPAVRYLSFLT